MADGVPEQTDGFSIEQIIEVVEVIFSWVILMPIAVIISGKLVAETTVRSSKEDDFLSINLLFFRIRATGDEVMWGFAVFILVMGSTVGFGGPAAYDFFKLNTGLDIGHWNSLCVIAAFFSVIVSLALWLVVPYLRSSPVISAQDRNAQIEKLKSQSSTKEDDNNG
jgi:hypothetical protein